MFILFQFKPKFISFLQKERFVHSEVPQIKSTVSLSHHLEINSLFKDNNQKNLESPSLMIYKASYKSLISIFTRIFAVLFYLCFSLNGFLSQDFLSSVFSSSVFISFILTDIIELLELLFGVLHVLSVILHSTISESHH